MKLPEDVLARIKTQVSIETDQDMAQFIADALNTYIILGNRVASGDTIVLRDTDGADRRVVLPCFSPGSS